MISPQNYNHDFAINPVMIYLFIVSIVLFVVTNRKKGWRRHLISFILYQAFLFFHFALLLDGSRIQVGT